jgi:hypothetical protein
VKHVEHGKKKTAYRVWVGKPEGKSSWEDLGVDDERKILKWILKKWDGKRGLG